MKAPEPLRQFVRQKIKQYYRKKLRLDRVAETKTEIDECASCNGTVTWFDLDKLSHTERYPFQNWQSQSKPIYKYRLNDVILDVFYMVFFKNGGIIPDGNHYITEELLDSIKVRPERVISYKEEGLVFSCFDHWENNYYHWIAHALPAYYAALSSGVKGEFLVPSPLLPWQQRTLELLGIDLTQCCPVEKDKQYAFSSVEYYEFSTGEADFVLSDLCVKAYQQVVRNVAAPTRPDLCHDKIYISRKTKENRSLSNEADLIAMLEQRGYFILDPEEYSIDEQILIFQQVKIVVALLGAGLSNIAFCKAGTIIYELIPSHHDNPCFLKMSVQGGLRYWADKFDTGVHHNRPDHLSAWVNALDVKAVEMRLNELEIFINSYLEYQSI